MICKLGVELSWCHSKHLRFIHKLAWLHKGRGTIVQGSKLLEVRLKGHHFGYATLQPSNSTKFAITRRVTCPKCRIGTKVRQSVSWQET